MYLISQGFPLNPVKVLYALEYRDQIKNTLAVEK